MVLECPLCSRLQSLEGDPYSIHNFKHTAAVLSGQQGPAGWCTLIYVEHVEHLAQLTSNVQAEIFGEVARVAQAIRAVFGPVRLNYECLGNICPHIHWHVIPRHANDPTPAATVWGWPAPALLGNVSHEERVAMVASLREALLNGEEP